MSSFNDKLKKEYLNYKKGTGEVNNRNLYIDSVVKHYGNTYSPIFDKDIYEIIIEKDSFFENISSRDAADVLKKAELGKKEKDTTMLKRQFKLNNKYEFTDEREVRPRYKDVSLQGVFGFSKNFKEMDLFK